MKYRIIIAILSLWTMACTMTAEDKVYGNPFIICIGKTAEIEVLLDNEAPYVGFQFDLILPYGMIVTGYEVDRNRIPASTDVSMAQQEDGSYRFFATAFALEPIVGSSGRILTVKLKTSNFAVAGNETIYIKNLKLSKADATGFSNLYWTSFATAKVLLMGDANADGVVDVTDVVAIANSILGRPSSSFDATAADVNGDGSIDVTDIVVIANMILRGNGQNNAKMRGGDEDDEEDEEEILDPQ